MAKPRKLASTSRTAERKRCSARHHFVRVCYLCQAVVNATNIPKRYDSAENQDNERQHEAGGRAHPAVALRQNANEKLAHGNCDKGLQRFFPGCLPLPYFMRKETSPRNSLTSGQADPRRRSRRRCRDLREPIFSQGANIAGLAANRAAGVRPHRSATIPPEPGRRRTEPWRP